MSRPRKKKTGAAPSADAAAAAAVDPYLTNGRLISIII
jgi:hypothetical protein